MWVVGTDAAGLEQVRFELEHGADPEVAAYDLGWWLESSVDAVLDPAGELVVTYRTSPVTDQPRPAQRLRGQDAGLDLDGIVPEIRQRVAAYAVVWSSAGLLATEYSGLTAVEGRWGMPGGGLDEGEDPRAAVLREVYEETGQQVELGPLVAVQTSHWIGRSPRGGIEDFHAVRLIYTGECAAPTEPVVHDADGTTAAARWVARGQVPDLPWTANWATFLGA